MPLRATTKRRQKGMENATCIECIDMFSSAVHPFSSSLCVQYVQIEATMSLHEHPGTTTGSDLEQYDVAVPTGSPGGTLLQRIAVFIDGSSTAFTALRYAVAGLCRKDRDHLYLINIMPYEAYRNDAERILQQAYDYAHHAGKVRPSTSIV